MARSSTRRWIVSFFLLALGVVAAWLILPQIRPPQFEATAKFQRRSDFADRDPKKPGPITEAYQRIVALREYNFKGRPAIEQLIRDLNLTKNIPHLSDGAMTPEGLAIYNALIESIARSITLDVEVNREDIELVVVNVSHEDPKLASRIANKLVENYMARVKDELDQTLMEQKKFYEQEVNRYRRKVSELEAARLRFAQQTGMAEFDAIDLADPISLYRAMNDDGLKRSHADAVKRLERLRELTKGRTVGDQVILELFRLEEDVERTAAALARHEANKEKLESINRNFFQIRNDFLKITRELHESNEHLVLWSEKLQATQQALTLSVSERGMRLSFVQRAPDY